MKLKPLIFYLQAAGLLLGANVAGMCSSFKSELLNGIHALGPGTGVPARTVAVADVVKAALFLASASRGVADTVYNTTGELAGRGKLVILPVDQGFEHGPVRSFSRCRRGGSWGSSASRSSSR